MIDDFKIKINAVILNQSLSSKLLNCDMQIAEAQRKQIIVRRKLQSNW